MILTDDFVFIHEPKTGGTFVTEMLSRIYEPVKQARAITRVVQRVRGSKLMLDTLKHGTCSEIPESHRRRPILATIRNPYDRYVSQYEFGWWKDQPPDYCDLEQLRKQFPNYPRLTFGEFIDLSNTLFLQLKNEALPPEEALGRQTEQFVKYFFRKPEAVFPVIDADYIAARRFDADMFPVEFIHTDHLNQELHDFLVKIGHPPKRVHFILESGKVFPKEGGRGDDKPWTNYYTPELKHLVRRRERLLFAKFPEFDV
ncbi:MAG TPA: sulfotransferase family 2 domain-containing protein [Verrucomicrobiae bacterium]|nr:sulfotransferase family 2 domain-containing protein [Verrucomicrobiae bacterium]